MLIRVWRGLGPGLLWAGTAIGVSHLVQSTRAGAGFGLALLWLVLLANVMKYPAFEAGPRYAAATGTSLLEGYRRRGKWVLWLFVGLTLSTMFTVLAGVTAVTAAMAQAMLSDRLSMPAWSGLLLVGSAALLMAGRFALLERAMKWMVGLLTLCTLAAVSFSVPRLVAAPPPIWPPLPAPSAANLMFLAGLVGWMPSAIDTAVWHSLWTLEKARTEGVPADRHLSRLDFDVGYWGTALLAAAFLLLGAAVLYGDATPLPAGGGAFATRLVDAYGQALGAWARPVVLVAAFATMLSTTIAVSDGFPRALEGAWRRLQGPERGGEAVGPLYFGLLAGQVLVALVILVWFAGQLTTLVDLATGLTGLTAPVLAGLNLIVLRGEEVPEDARPSGAFLYFHVLGVVFLAGMALLYVVARFSVFA